MVWFFTIEKNQAVVTRIVLPGNPPSYIHSQKPRTMDPQAKYTNVCFTWNNPNDVPIGFETSKMSYLVYQEEVGENGTHHYQGYVELKRQLRLNQVKTLLGSDTIHIARRRGTSEQASEYCKKEDTRVPGTQPYEFGVMKATAPGKRNDLKDFKDNVMDDRKRKRDLVEDHYGTLARYPRFYHDLTLLNRPANNPEVEVILHFGATGLGKTRSVMDAHLQDDSFFIAPLSNGTPWYDTYDLDETVLIDDFAGAASHLSLVALLRLLDVYPLMVPVKCAHTWWRPKTIYITSNILPKDWYKWEKRGSQYLALARRFTKVVLFYPKLFADDPGFVEQDKTWWVENCPDEALPYYS